MVSQRTCITCTLFLVSLLLGSVSTTARALTRSSTAAVAEQYLLSAANKDRAARGLSPLRRDPVLAEAAAGHAREMARHSDISHGFPGEPDLASRAATVGVRFSLITENVGEAPDFELIHDLWMHSEGHRANLLDPKVDSIGISVVAQDEQLYAVEDFATTVPNLTLDQQEATISQLLGRTGVQVIQGEAPVVADARQTCATSTGYIGSRRPWFVLRYTAASLADLPNQLASRISSGKYHQAVVGACPAGDIGGFSAYNLAILLYP
jgi:hypothetical protein